MEASQKGDIDNEQPETIEEHFKIIMADETCINSECKKKTPADLPNWFDKELFKIGQDYFCMNVLGLVSSYLSGLIAVLLVPKIAKILTFTDQSSTPCTAYKRYFQTTLHVYNLHTCDCQDATSNFYRSLNLIRMKHAYASRRTMQYMNEGITQKEMVLTQFGFIGYILTHAKVTSLTNKPLEREGINHFWRVIGHLLDIPDRLNLCRRNAKETTELCTKVTNEVYKKQLDEPPLEFLRLTTSAIAGLQCVDPLIDVDAFLDFFYELNNRQYKKEVSLYTKCNIMYRKLQFYLMGKPIIGYILRSFWNLYLPTIFWAYEKCSVIAWYRYGWENSKINLYPRGF